MTGTATTVLETVLRCDTERSELLEQEAALLARINGEAPTGAAVDGNAALRDGGAAVEENGLPAKKKASTAASGSDPELASKLEKVCPLVSP